MTSPGGLRPVRAWLCLGLLLGLPLLLSAAEPAPKTVEPADDDLIEFLGSVDSDDEGWKQYLRRMGTQQPAAKKPPPAPPPPPSSAPGKDDAKDVH
jgi:hypothetical protein